MTLYTYTLDEVNLKDLPHIGQVLASHLHAVDAVLLEGPLGCGKTTLCQHILAARGIPPHEVTSPTFGLVHTYDDVGEATSVWHMDLYRLTHVEDLYELGVDEALATALCLIEWPDRLGYLMPSTHLHIALHPTAEATTRTLVLTAKGAWAARLPELFQAMLPRPTVN